MIKFNNTQTSGWEAAVAGMRKSYNSEDKSDSIFLPGGPQLGKNDLKLMHTLATGSNSEAKFLRGIQISTELTAPAYFWAEMDTYKVGTVRLSSSLQHTGAARDLTIEDFTNDWHEMSETDRERLLKRIYEDEPNILLAGSLSDIVTSSLDTHISNINTLLECYRKTKNYTYFRLARQLMPMGYNYSAIWVANYAVLRAIYHDRKKHMLDEWSGDTSVCQWIENLPYSQLITDGPRQGRVIDPAKKEVQKQAGPRSIMTLPIELCNFGSRGEKVLRTSGAKTLGDAVEFIQAGGLLGIQGIGPVTIAAILEAVKNLTGESYTRDGKRENKNDNS